MDKHIIINIGRQYGSGGRIVAEALGKRLGLAVYDRELLIKAAEKSGLSEALFKQNDERRSFLNLDSVFGAPRYGDFGRNMLNDGELYRIQSETIRDLAMQGSAIFVGRASDYVLRDLVTLDVFISAPLEVRKATVAARLGVSADEAEVIIRKQDRRRKDYYDLITMGDNWGVAGNYDLCVDSSILGPEGTADFIIRFGQETGRI
ncbi:MAG: cytidylate kinase-like family protein [Bacteroidales bacterium]|nr:cytidylate kinase-like family protein [Bacteroidales bacterium]